jgi:hypothetical protein
MLSTRQIRHLWVASNITVSFYPCIWQWDSQFWPNGHITLNAPALVRSLKFSTWDCLGILGAFFLEQLCRHNCLPTKLTLLFIQYPIDKYKSINKFVWNGIIDVWNLNCDMESLMTRNHCRGRSKSSGELFPLVLNDGSKAWWSYYWY